MAIAYVVMGAAMGTVAGTGLAIATLQTQVPTVATLQVTPAVEASTTSNVQSLPAPASEPGFIPVREEVRVPSAVAAPALAVIEHARPSEQRKAVPAPHVVRPAAHPVFAIVNASVPVMPVNAPAAATVRQAATASEARISTFMSEGDVTVAEFDAAMGRIETYEGRTFVLGGVTAPAVAASLQDSGTSVHYRCDQGGSCTLMRAGLVMQNVKLL
jgi:hypothetical protein